MGTSGFWLCLWRLSIPSHLLKRSRPSWLIHLYLWLPPPLLLLLQPQRRLKPRNSRRNQMKIWDLVSNSQSNQFRQLNRRNMEIKAYFCFKKKREREN
ncbi:hypothetical protein LEMLEM_LOCUS25458 [Lemmus lemmus]